MNVNNVTFSSPCSNIDNERHSAQSPIEKGPCDQQTIAKIFVGNRSFSQASLMLDLCCEEWIRPDMCIRGIRAEFRRDEALDADSKRGLKERFLCLNSSWNVA